MSRSPASNSGRALAAALALLAGAALAAPATAQRAGAEDMNLLHDRCIAFVREHPKEGLDKAKIWREQGGGFWADHCVATALFVLRDFAGAAKRFEALATAMMAMPAPQRAVTLDQAGQAWLDANEFARAKADFDAAIAINGEDPDLLIDRAEAYAAMNQYWDAIDDLNRCIELAPKRAEPYIYRASAYRSVDALDLAFEDVERGLKLAPDSVLGLLERGNLRRLKGDIAGARTDWQRVEKLDPKGAAAKAAKINLARLGTKDEAKPETALPRKLP